jgi:hypothetical protein
LRFQVVVKLDILVKSHARVFALGSDAVDWRHAVEESISSSADDYGWAGRTGDGKLADPCLGGGIFLAQAEDVLGQTNLQTAGHRGDVQFASVLARHRSESQTHTVHLVVPDPDLKVLDPGSCVDALASEAAGAQALHVPAASAARAVRARTRADAAVDDILGGGRRWAGEREPGLARDARRT